MYKVLLADDEFYVRVMIRQAVCWEELGFTIVAEAENGEEALEMAQQCIPDLVIADIEMPFLDGLKLAETLLQRRPELRVIFLTCHDRFEYARRAIRCGVEDYLLKPIVPEELTRALLKVRDALDIQTRGMDQTVWTVSTYSLLLEKFEKSLSTGDCGKIGEFLADLFRSAEKGSMPCSAQAMIQMLMKIVESYCAAKQIDFCWNEEELTSEEFIQLTLDKVCGVGAGIERQKQLILDTQGYITAHLGDPGLSLSSIARSVYVNPSYLSRVYNQETGESISTFIRDARLSRAVKLIKNGAQNVEGVAEEVGFRNAGYFSRCFKERYGISPVDMMKRRTGP